jgi:DNA-binding NtrC family response regulator
MLTTLPVLVVSDDAGSRDILADLVLKYGSSPICCQTLAAANALLDSQSFGAVICLKEAPNQPLKQWIHQTRNRNATPPVIVVSDEDDWNCYLTVMHWGAFDSVSFPPHPGEIERSLWLALSESRRRGSPVMKLAA